MSDEGDEKSSSNTSYNESVSDATEAESDDSKLLEMNEYIDKILNEPQREVKKMTRNILNKYEKTSIIALRAEQLSNGAESYLSEEILVSMTNVMDIAKKEFEHEPPLIPFIIRRPISNYHENWKLTELIN
jgi:DNA-directed RNA polymerase subunit K/omega